MNPCLPKKIKALRKEIRRVLANKLTYPKTVISLIGKRKLKEDEIMKAGECIDECLHMVEARFLECLESLE